MRSEKRETVAAGEHALGPSARRFAPCGSPKTSPRSATVCFALLSLGAWRPTAGGSRLSRPSGPAREVPAPPRRGTSSSGTPDSNVASSSGPASDDGTSAAPKRYDLDAPDGTPPASDLTVEVDALTIPGTFASGAVTFSDGTKAKWYLDQQGRLGLDDVPPGYRPSPGDAALFQARLVEALRARGLA